MKRPNPTRYISIESVEQRVPVELVGLAPLLQSQTVKSSSRLLKVERHKVQRLSVELSKLAWRMNGRREPRVYKTKLKRY